MKLTGRIARAWRRTLLGAALLPPCLRAEEAAAPAPAESAPPPPAASADQGAPPTGADAAVGQELGRLRQESPAAVETGPSAPNVAALVALEEEAEAEQAERESRALNPDAEDAFTDDEQRREQRQTQKREWLRTASDRLSGKSELTAAERARAGDPTKPATLVERMAARRADSEESAEERAEGEDGDAREGGAGGAQLDPALARLAERWGMPMGDGPAGEDLRPDDLTALQARLFFGPAPAAPASGGSSAGEAAPNPFALNLTNPGGAPTSAGTATRPPGGAFNPYAAGLLAAATPRTAGAPAPAPGPGLWGAPPPLLGPPPPENGTVSAGPLFEPVVPRDGLAPNAATPALDPKYFPQLRGRF